MSTATAGRSLLESLVYGVRRILAFGSELPLQSSLNFTGDVVVTDDPDNGRTNVAIGADAAVSSVVLTAGAGLTGGGDLTANRTFAVGAGTDITVAADAVSVDSATANTASKIAKRTSAGMLEAVGLDRSSAAVLTLGGNATAVKVANGIITTPAEVDLALQRSDVLVVLVADDAVTLSQKLVLPNVAASALGHVGMDTATGRILLYVGSASVSVMTYADILHACMPKAADATLLAASGVVILPRVYGNKTLVAVRLFSSGNLTASDTDYTTYTAYVWRSGALSSIGALTTKTAGGSGGTGDWAFGSLFAFPIGITALLDGDAIVISQSKTGLGVIAPVTTFQVDYKHAV